MPCLNRTQIKKINFKRICVFSTYKKQKIQTNNFLELVAHGSEINVAELAKSHWYILTDAYDTCTFTAKSYL